MIIDFYFKNKDEVIKLSTCPSVITISNYLKKTNLYGLIQFNNFRMKANSCSAMATYLFNLSQEFKKSFFFFILILKRIN